MARALGLLLAIGVRLLTDDTWVPHGRGRVPFGACVPGDCGVLVLRAPPGARAIPRSGFALLQNFAGAQVWDTFSLSRNPGRLLHLCECGVEAAFQLLSRNPSWVGPQEKGLVAGWVGSPPPGVLLPHLCDAGSSPGRFRAVWRRGSLNRLRFFHETGTLKIPANEVVRRVAEESEEQARQTAKGYYRSGGGVDRDADCVGMG